MSLRYSIIDGFVFRTQRFYSFQNPTIQSLKFNFIETRGPSLKKSIKQKNLKLNPLSQISLLLKPKQSNFPFSISQHHLPSIHHDLLDQFVSLFKINFSPFKINSSPSSRCFSPRFPLKVRSAPHSLSIATIENTQKQINGPTSSSGFSSSSSCDTTIFEI